MVPLRPLSAAPLLFAFAASGCALFSGVSKTDPPKDGIVHTMRQGAAGEHANVYWFETEAGAVVVDAPLTVSDAKKLRGAMTHPYRIFIGSARPERFASLATLREGDVGAFTTPSVNKEMQERGDGRLAPLHKQYGNDVPTHVDAPNPAVEERTHDKVGGVELELLPLGPAESESSLAVFLPKSGELIAGDVVVNHEHVDLTWGRSVVWQDRLNELRLLQPKYVYPGHGAPGGPELLEQTAGYIKYLHDLIAQKVKPGAPAHITPADLTAIKQQMTARFPKYGRPELLDKSIPAVYATQLAALPPPPPKVETPPAPPPAEAKPAEAKPEAPPVEEPAKGKKKKKGKK